MHLQCQAHLMKPIRKTCPCCPCTCVCSFISKLVVECVRRRLQNLDIFENTMHDWEATMHLTIQNTVCEWDSQRTPLNFQHKQDELNAHAAWRPRWTTAEQVHTDAQTYASAQNALHTCIPHACTHWSAHIAHVCRCGALHIFPHEHSYPLSFFERKVKVNLWIGFINCTKVHVHVCELES